MERVSDEDPTFRVKLDPETGQTIISGMGELHLEIIVDRLLREFGVEAPTWGVPRCPTERRSGTRPRSGGASSSARPAGTGNTATSIDVEPLPRGGGFEFVSKVTGNAIPKEFIPAVEKG